MEWCCEEDAARALAGQKTYDTWQQGFLQILEALRKDKAFFTSVYRSISREQLENYLYRLTYDLMMGVVEERAAGMTVRPEDKEFIANFYKFAFVGLTLDWIKNDMRQDPAQLVEQLTPYSPGAVQAQASLYGAGLSPEQTLGTLERMVTGQAAVLASNEYFWLSGFLFLSLLGLVWLARPQARVAMGPGADH